MKRIRTRALSMLLAIVLLLGMIPAVSISTSAAVAGTEIATGSGAGDRWLKADTYYDTKKALEGTPLTFEVVIKHPDGGSRRDSSSRARSFRPCAVRDRQDGSRSNRRPSDSADG